MSFRISFLNCLLTLSCAFLTAGASAAAPEAAPTVTVEVTGYGSNVSEARADAVRQAMQLALSQLVISDVDISNDEILQDRVRSTMNGFVDKVEERSLIKDGDEYVVKSTITVSTQRMSNFLGLPTSASGMDGLSLFSELNRESEQRALVSEILFRAFRGFPQRTIETKVTAIKPVSDNPEEIQIDFTIAPNEQWIASLRDTLKALSKHSIDISFRQSPRQDSGNLYCRDSMLSGAVQLAHWDCERDAAYRSVISSFTQSGSNIRPICLMTAEKASCYILPSGNYGKLFYFATNDNSPYRPLPIRFIAAPFDELGNLTITGSCCQPMTAMKMGPSEGFSHEGYSSNTWYEPKQIEALWQFNARTYSPNRDLNFIAISPFLTSAMPAQIRIRRDSLDLARTKGIAILPVLVDTEYASQGEVIFDVVDEPSHKAVSDAVRSAVQEASLRTGG